MAADPVTLRNSRRENPVIATLPPFGFYPAMMRRIQVFCNQGFSVPRD
jgi:hypothetical protein